MICEAIEPSDTTGLKHCPKCNEWRDKSQFYKGPNKDGLRSQCKICAKAYHASTPHLMRARCQRYREKYRDKERQRGRKYLADNPEKKMFAAARLRAEKKGLPFDITLADVVIPDRCPILDIPLRRDSHTREDKPSFDKVINEVSYVKGNVAVVSGRANRIKSDATLEEHYAIAGFMETFRDKDMSFSDHMERIRDNWSAGR